VLQAPLERLVQVVRLVLQERLVRQAQQERVQDSFREH
jgi:hypothetical protein